MGKLVKIEVDGKSSEFPVMVGTENELGIDISKLRSSTGYITYDPAYGNTGSAKSAITFLDGEKGILRYRGYPIEQLAEKSNFVEVAHLLIYGDLPTFQQYEDFNRAITRHSLLHEDLIHFFDNFPSSAHPMAILSAMVGALSGYYPRSMVVENKEERETNIIRLLSKMRTIACYSYKKSIGQPLIYPLNNLSYCENILRMMNAVPCEDYDLDPDWVRALDLLLILHADHEQNCSTSTVRLVGSSQANVFASISAGICALWGPLHGGANQEVIEMLQEMHTHKITPAKFLESVQKKERKLMGFGHRVYKNFDPRSKIIKGLCDKVVRKKAANDPLLDIALQLEEAALKDNYFVDRKLYPNVDFYSGIIYRAMGIPENMFTVMFALGRLPGWIAHWKELLDDPETRIGRPRQIYTGQKSRDFVPMNRRG